MKRRKSIFARARVWRVLKYGLATAMLFWLDNVVENMKSGSEISFDSIYTHAFSPTSLYPWTSSWFRKPKTNHVAIVTVGEPDEAVSDQCARRAFIADVLDGIKSVSPKAIAIDYAFGQNNCLGDHDLPLTRKLRKALIAASNTSLVVLGQAAYRQEDLETNWPSKFLETRKHGFDRADLLLRGLPGAFAGLDSNIKPGLIQLNADYRKIPLNWPAFAESNGRRITIDTLSVAAARSFSGDQTLLDRISDLQKEGKHPFTSFAREEQLTIISATDIVCGEIDPAQCEARNAARFPFLKDRVILISIIDNSDVHETLIGKVPGVILQANYIESLIDHRFLRPVDKRIQFAVGLAWFTLIELLLKRWRARGWGALLYPLVTIVLLWTTISILVSSAGFYIELLFPSIFVLIAPGVGEKIRGVLDSEHEKGRGRPHDQTRVLPNDKSSRVGS